ncbi:MAG: carbohydrate binding domain-containing protein [Fibrobacterota bacterium]
MRVYKPATAGPFSLTTQANGNGTITVSPQQQEYALNDEVIIEAIPDDGYEFLGWMGDITSSEDILPVTMTSDLFLSAWFGESGSMLVNGDFSSGASGWILVGNLEGASATGAVENQEYHVSISSGGTADYAIQLNRPGLSFTEGEAYRVSFDARADAPRTIKAKINQSVADWTTYHSTEHRLTTEHQTYTFDFTMDYPSDDNARVEFNLGLSDIDVYIDNVEVIKLADTRTAKPFPRKKARTNIIHTSRSLTIQPNASCANEEFKVTVYDLRGQVIKKVITRDQKDGRCMTVDISTVPHGTYILCVEAGKINESGVFVLKGQ